jgi:hypothetical protein
MTFPEIPPEYLDQRTMQRDVELHMSVLKLLALHGAAVLALKHPEMPADAAKLLNELATKMEYILEEIGLPEPASSWRGE